MKSHLTRGFGQRCLRAAFAICLVAATVADARAQDRAGDERMPIAGGTSALLQQCGIRASVDPARAMLVLVRAVHASTPVSESPPPPSTVVVSALQAARAKNLPAEEVPALLPLPVWQAHIFSRSIDAGNLASAIISDRRASLLYYGLFSLDDETLAFLTAHPSVLSSIYRDYAAVFAGFAESITVHDGRVALPGDAGAKSIWERLVGAPADNPARFIPWLLARDDGRLAWMFDTIAHLDEPHRDFALGRQVGGPGQRVQYVTALYAIFAGFHRRALAYPARPFVRGQIDPPFVLGTVAVTDDGRLAPPAEVSVWTGPFEVTDAGAAGDITAPWLLEHIFTPAGRSRLDTFLFAQRVFAAGTGRGGRMDQSALPPVLSAFPTHQALMLSLERLGVVDPRDYGAALAAATALTSGVDDTAATLRVAMFQGALALLVRLHDVGTLDEARVQGLVRTLVALPAGQPNGYGDALAQWTETQLMPALSGAGGGGSMDAEARLLDGLSGGPALRSAPVVRWEDQTYSVDLAAAERRRLRLTLDRQGACPLTMALDLRRLARSTDGPAAAAQLTDLVSQIDLFGGGMLFGRSIAARRGAFLSDLRALQQNPAEPDRRQAVRRDAAETLDVLMADILAAHVYAIAIEDPESPLLLVDRVWRTHDFDVRVSHPARSGAWALPASVRAETASVFRGSLFGLERTAAVFSLRRMSLDSPSVAPVLEQRDAVGLAESAAALDSFRLTDASRDVVAAALARGRERLAAVSRDPAAVDGLAAEVQVERWRRRLMRWEAARDPGSVARYLSLGEILALGCPNGVPAEADDWGVSQRLADGSFRVRLPVPLAWHQMSGRRGVGLMAARVADLPLRVAEWLAELKLPAVLAHDVVEYATWDLIISVQMADLDDWFALVRRSQALAADQMADYVSALTADGPLVFVK